MRVSRALAALGTLSLAGLALKNWLDASRVLPPKEATPLQVDGRTIYAIDRGPPNAQAVVLLHGSIGSCWDWLPVIPALEDRYRVVAPERPGMGWSDSIGSHRLASTTETVYRALRALDVDRPVLVGASYGGGLACRMAVDHPGYAAGLLLLASVGPAWSPEGTPLETTSMIGKMMMLPAVGPLLAWTIAPPLGRRIFSSDRTLRAHFGPDLDVIPPEAVREWIRICMRPVSIRAWACLGAHLLEDMRDLEPRLGEIDAPTWVASGEMDPVVPARVGEALAAAIPHAHAVLIPNAAHAFAVSRPHEVRRLVDEVAAAVEVKA